MGWGFYGYGGYGRGRQPGKKETAASLSTGTLQKIIAQQKAEEEAQARYMVIARQRREEEEKRQAEERRLIELHGSAEALAKWRADNAERLAAERMEKLEAQRKAAGEKAIVDEMAELKAELARLPATSFCAAKSQVSFQMNKSQVKAAFHLTDRELEALPKEVIQKEGAKRPSKILWASVDIFAAVTRKEGKRRLRQYQTAYNPSLARAFIADELLLLESQHPALVERSRTTAVATLRAADDEAINASKTAEQQVEAALRALEAAHEKQRSVRNALLQVATADELGAMHLAALPERPEEDDEEEGYRSTHPKAPVSRTPFTMAAAGANKKQKLTSAGGAGSSSAGAGVDVD